MIIDRNPGTRLVIAGVSGAAAFCLVLWLRIGGRSNFSDFDHLWVGARALWSGLDPYVVVPHLGYQRPLYYPAPAIIAALPFALFSMVVAHAAFAAVGTAFFAFALTRRNWWPLLGLLSFGTIDGIQLGQWSLLASGIAAVPALAWLAVIKPTTAAVAGAAYFPDVLRRRTLEQVLALSTMVTAASFLLLPQWPREWLHAVRSAQHFRAPATYAWGVVLLAALLRWRVPEARLVAFLALVPQSISLYETAPLGLVANTRREAMILVAGSVCAKLWLETAAKGHGNLADTLQLGAPAIIAFVYLPALLIVLRRPNVGPVPELAERLARHLPTWLRGAPAEWRRDE